MALWSGLSSPERVAAIAALQTPDTVGAISFDATRAALMKPGRLNSLLKAMADVVPGSALLHGRHLRQNLGFTASVFTTEFVEALGAITQPTLISNSRADSIVAYSSRETFLEAIPSSIAIDLPAESGHHVPREQPRETVEVLERFLDGLEAPSHRSQIASALEC